MSADSSAAASRNALQALDDSKITRFQIKTMFVSGMGFFTDAYDLFVIGIVVRCSRRSGPCRPARCRG
jgi:MFS transporter, PHS family, inorganic phosphate transporter